MRVVIVGKKWLAAEVLGLCLRRADDVALVMAEPDEDGGGGRLFDKARDAGVPCRICRGPIQPAAIPADVDLILAANSHVFIGAGARSATRLGALGYHPSLLPRHRGRDAVRWTIHTRDPIAGGTVYWMDDGADTGPVAKQDWCFVRPMDDAKSLWLRELAPMGVRLFSESLAEIDSGVIMAVPQESSVATWEPSFSGARLAIFERLQP